MDNKEINRIIKTLLSISCDERRDAAQREQARIYADGLMNIGIAEETLK
jgi:hypothetical protein